MVRQVTAAILRSPDRDPTSIGRNRHDVRACSVSEHKILARSLARETIGPMNPSARSELEALRYRAYGPSADISGDPEALRRLADLEGASLRSDPDSPAAEAASEAPPTRSPSPTRDAQNTSSVTLDTGQAGTTPDAPVAGTPAPAARAPRRKVRRLVWIAWIASLVAVAALAAVATYGLVSIAPVRTSSGAPQVATLEPDSAVAVPTGWFGAGASSATYTFFGLTLFETSYGMYGNGGGDCFAAALSSDMPEESDPQNGYSASGPVYSGCRFGDFPATITFEVDSNAPPELRDRFPDASLQFVKDGDRIGVFVSPSSSD